MAPSVFLFHRDLRLEDNTAFNAMVADAVTPVCLVFVIDPVQANRKVNSFFSNSAFQFMSESLAEIPNLNVLVGDTLKVLQKLHSDIKFDKLYQNSDVSLFARQRDEKIRTWCEGRHIVLKEFEDHYLYGVDEMLVKDRTPYTVFSAFSRRCVREGVGKIRKPSYTDTARVRFLKLPGQPRDLSSFMKKLYTFNPDLAQRGGRSHGEAILKSIPLIARNYGNRRDFPEDGKKSTTQSSAHLKFGTISPREFFWRIGKLNHPLIRELLFRDFYAKVYSHDPLLQRGKAFDDKVDKRVPWVPCKGRLFEDWVRGHTGFPLVDAGMRQLRKTGWIHNRVRMTTASFATKYCLFDWRDCAKYFYTQLVDCDVFSNTAGWGFVSSTGVDPQPWFRYPMNPFLQSQKFDKDAKYIKKWVPELKDVPPRDIHRWYDEEVRKSAACKYPAPNIDFKEASRRSKRVFTGR